MNQSSKNHFQFSFICLAKDSPNLITGLWYVDFSRNHIAKMAIVGNAFLPKRNSRTLAVECLLNNEVIFVWHKLYRVNFHCLFVMVFLRVLFQPELNHFYFITMWFIGVYVYNIPLIPACFFFLFLNFLCDILDILDILAYLSHLRCKF